LQQSHVDGLNATLPHALLDCPLQLRGRRRWAPSCPHTHTLCLCSLAHLQLMQAWSRLHLYSRGSVATPNRWGGLKWFKKGGMAREGALRPPPTIWRARLTIDKRLTRSAYSIILLKEPGHTPERAVNLLFCVLVGVCVVCRCVYKVYVGSNKCKVWEHRTRAVDETKQRVSARPHSPRRRPFRAPSPRPQIGVYSCVVESYQIKLAGKTANVVVGPRRRACRRHATVGTRQPCPAATERQAAGGLPLKTVKGRATARVMRCN
jgi:hypothetical protein